MSASEFAEAPYPVLVKIAAMPAGPARDELAERTIGQLLAAAEGDRLEIQRIRNAVRGLRLLSMGHFDELARAGRPERGGRDRPGDAAELGAETGPEARVRMSSGDWRFSEGDDGYDRGLYWGARHLAGLPYIHARLIHRDGGGRRKGTSYLLSATPAGPRLVISHLKIKDGTWAPELGMTLPDEPKTIQAAGTAIRQLAENASEEEAVPRIDGDRLLIPPRECLPDGYLVTADCTRAEALARWHGEVLPLAALVPNLAGMVGASAFAPFAHALGVHSHFFDGFGDQDQGKSTALKLSASVWGDCREVGGTMRLWNFTSDISLARFLGKLGVLPAFIDEGGAAGFTRSQWGYLIYRVMDGAQRSGAQRNDEDGLRTGLRWYSTLFMTGNAFVGEGLSAGQWSGIPKRIVEAVAPFTTDAAHAEALDQLADETFGHLGAELLERFDVAAARQFYAAAAEYAPLAEGGNPRTWSKQVRGHVAGAMMLDALCGTGTLLTDATAAWASAFLAAHCTGPRHDAELLLDAIRESIARERMRWPTVAEYREQLRPRPVFDRGDHADPSRTELPQHGVARLDMAGVRANDDSWVAVFPSAMHESFTEPRGISEERAFRELFNRGVLKVAPSLRTRGDWLTSVRLEPKPHRPESMYRLVLPPVEDADEDDEGQGETTETNPSDSPPRVFSPAEPQTPQTPQVNRGEAPQTPPQTPPKPHPKPHPKPPLADGAPGRDTCRACGKVLHPLLIADGAEYHHGCAPAEVFAGWLAGKGYAPAAAPAAAIAALTGGEGQGAAPAAPAAPTAPAPSTAPPPRRRWVVLGGDGRAYAAVGEVIELPEGALDRCVNTGELAALALALGAERCYVPAAARQALRLPATLPDAARPAEGHPHMWTESTDPAAWDIWPADPVGLAPWMTVYRLPRTMHEGTVIAFPEWMANTPALGELAAPELARALELIGEATRHPGGGGGVEFHRSPASTFGRLLDKAARYSRTGRREAVELPPPYDRTARPPRGAPAPLKAPGPHMAPPAEVPAGWILARLDVRSCFASAATGTDFGAGEAVHTKGGELGKAPGAHLVRVPAGAAAHPALTPLVPPAAGKAREVLAWLDTVAARWLAECGVPVEVIESWTWPEKWRVFDSALGRLGDARARLEAAGGVPELAAAAVVKSMANAYLGGRLKSDYGGDRRADDWTWRADWWFTIRAQAEVRKQRNLLPALASGTIAVLGSQQIDSVYVAAPALAVIEAMPGSGGRPAVADGRGKFKIEAHAAVSPELAAALADPRGTGHARLAAVKRALGEGK